MRAFLKPFLLAMLALLLATSLTRVETNPQGSCNATFERPLVAFTDGNPCASPVAGLYARGAIAQPLAALFGVVVPLLLLEIAFLMVISQLAGRVPMPVATAFTIAFGAVFAAVSLAQYRRWHAFDGRADQLSLWLSNPLMARDAVIWLVSGLGAGSGIALVAVALQGWRARVVLKS